MKKTQLTLAVLAATLLLSGCGGDSHKDVEKRYTALIQENVKLANTYQQQAKVEITEQTYNQEKDSATAKDVIAITPPKSKDSVHVTINSTISYPKEKDVLAVADSSFTVAPADLQNFIDSQELGLDASTINRALTYFSAKQTFLKDDNLIETLTIKPLTLDGKSDNGSFKISYEGFSSESHLKQKALDSFSSDEKGSFNSGAFLFNTSPYTVNISPIIGTSSSSKSGTLHYQTEPFSATFLNGRDTTSQININSLTLDGKSLKYDNDIAMFLGTTLLTANDVQVESDYLPEIIALSNIKIEQNNQQEKKGLYSIGNAISVEPKTNIPAFFGIDKLMVNRILFSINSYHLSKEGIAILSAYGNAPELRAEASNKLIDELNKNKPEIDINLAIDTEQGKATATLHIILKSISQEDINAWQQALLQGKGNNNQLMQLLMKDADIDAKLVLPKAIALQSQTDGLINMFAGRFIQDDGKNYVITLMTKDNQLFINGKALTSLLD